MAFTLPRTLTLPSKARVTLRRSPRASRDARDDAPATTSLFDDAPATTSLFDDAPATTSLFDDVLALFDRGVVTVEQNRSSVDVGDLPLADFHVLRAFLTKAGLVAEDDVELDCHNCGALLVARPCAGLETGPWEDGELDDPELDRTAELGIPLPTTIHLGRVRRANTLVLAPRTVREALPLWKALAEDPVSIDATFVEALGLRAIGTVEDPRRLARLLADDDRAFEIVADAFLAAHYPLRLACDVFCPKCKARSTIDAPSLRELEPSEACTESVAPTEADDAREHGPLPPLDEFVELAHAIVEPLIAEIPGEKVQLVVDDGTPAVDDGGEPLLGSYVPAPPRDAPVPTQPPTVTVYYRTFARIEREEAAFDWNAELRETLRHELEHHVFHLRGDDPMDEEEHAEIDREVVRVIGQGEATRRTLIVFGRSVSDFARHAWPLFLIGAAALAVSLSEGRCQ